MKKNQKRIITTVDMVKKDKLFKSIDVKKLETIIGGPETPRGTVTTVQQGT
ncbi:hypothetical protein ACFSJW_16845 [Flavobacterium artemisiae]|uniref:Bacteriocin-type signal sequence-containing protein n=1 Tax=Flavobacterium artemisiae TaxID=2126556 RepID=A0ABW4H983_9FLAO